MIGLSARFLKVKQTYNIASISLLAYVAGVNGEGVGRAVGVGRYVKIASVSISSKNLKVFQRLFPFAF